MKVVNEHEIVGGVAFIKASNTAAAVFHHSVCDLALETAGRLREES